MPALAIRALQRSYRFPSAESSSRSKNLKMTIRSSSLRFWSTSACPMALARNTGSSGLSRRSITALPAATAIRLLAISSAVPLLFQILIREQAQAGLGHRSGLALSRHHAAGGQCGETLRHPAAKSLDDLRSRSAHFPQGGQTEILVALLAQVEQVIVGIAQRSVQGRRDAVEDVLLQRVEQRADRRVRAESGVRGGPDAHDGACDVMD